MSKSDLVIDILGTEITITTDEEPEYLDTLLDKYRQTIENVRSLSGLKDPLKVAVLTGFLLCDDLEKAGNGEAKNKMAGEAEKLTMGIISRLDEALKVSENVAADAPAPVTTVSEVTIDTIYKLENTVKNYNWGSPEWLPAFLGQKNPSRIPWAELWLGVNPSGPSRVVPLSRPLSELIAGNPQAFLGKETAARYGTLPFLLKVLAAAKPLSIQVHPNAEQARQGFDMENKKGIPLDAANRNYRDPNEKSEILCALGPFAALCGFRKAEEITLLLEIFLLNTGLGESGLRNSLQNIVSTLKQEIENQDGNQGKNPLKSFLSSLFALDSETLLGLGSFVKDKQPKLERDFPEYRNEWYLCTYLASLYPGDSGIIAPLYLNIVDLAPEEAIYIPAGTPHAYINGMGIELLSDSDNVLRGGLTPKHVDHAELMKITNFSEFMPKIFRLPKIMRPPEPTVTKLSSPTQLASAISLPSSLLNYPAGEFALSVMRGSGAGFTYTNTGPSILIVTEGGAVVNEGSSVENEGGAVVNEGGAEMPLKKGESVFIPAGKKAVFSGVFTAYVASCVSP
jgi:mannose-6-phosphate isomerase